MVSKEKLEPGAVVFAVFTTAIEKQYPLAMENVARLRRVHPEKTPAELVTLLARLYSEVVTTTGAGAGAAAVGSVN